MPEWEAGLRLASFAGLFGLFALLELWRPYRPARRRRWGANLGLLVLGSLLVRLVFPLAATGVALWAEQQSWGLFNHLLLPGYVEVALAVLALDCAIYFQHRAFHWLPCLWRLHRVHHADTALDVTTGLRFHPLELLLSMLIKSLFIVIIGAPAFAVLLFEVMLNACSMFNHSNIVLPARLERGLRGLLITPSLHRIHHSRRGEETLSNFGFSVPWWDRLFGSFKARASAGDKNLRLGLPGTRQYPSRLILLLVLPWKRDSQDVERPR